MMEDYKILKFLGQGSYGEVQLVKHVIEEKEYVLKKIGLQRASSKERFAAEQEATMLSQLKHINIVSYKQSFQNSGTLFIIMQYCEGGDLHTWLQNRKGRYLDELKIILWFVQISLALQYLHGKNILHRDIKTQNIFLTHKNEIVKLGDLGIARQLSDTQDMARTIIGTPYYMSPELFSNRPYSFKSDIWSLGCVVYELCTFKHAFRARDFSGLAYKICTGKVPPLPDKYSTELGCLVSSMLEQEPDDRPSVHEIFHKKFIRQYIEVFIKRNREDHKPKITSESADKIEDSKRPLRSSSIESSVTNTPVCVKSDYHPHIRQQSNKKLLDKGVKDKQDNDENKISNKPSSEKSRRVISSKRLSNSNHLALIPSVINLLKKDELKQNGTKEISRRRGSKDGNKEPEPPELLPPPPPISSARKRRIEDKRKRSKSADRSSPDIFSSSSSDSPSPTLDLTRPASPVVNNPPRSQSPGLPPRSQSPGLPPRSQSPGIPPRSQSPGLPPRSQSPGPPPRSHSPIGRSNSPAPCISRPPSPCSSRPESPKPCTRPENPAEVPGLLTPNSPAAKKKSASNRKYRPLPPTPPSAKVNRRKTKSNSEEDKLVNLMNETLSLGNSQPSPTTSPIVYRPLPTREIPPTPETPQFSRLKNRLEKLRNQVLPCVSRDVLEQAYRVLDESDPDKVQGELMLLVGGTTPGICNKVMELYICEQRLKNKNSLFQSM